MRVRFFLVVCALSLSMGCSSDSSTTVAPAFVSMSTASAQSLVDLATSLCAASGNGAASGAAPTTISVGTYSVPANHTYTLSGGTTTITSGYGNLWIVGTGSVTVAGTFTGNLQICGPDITRVTGSNSAGATISVVSGNVGDVDSFVGTIAISDGDLTGDVTDSLLTIAWNNGTTTQGRVYTGR